jgi:transcriptional regulator with XRE-family HTH domain
MSQRIIIHKNIGGGVKMDKQYMAETLKRLRGNKTQEEVANALHISISALSMYECGERVPRDEIKKKLAEHYGRTVQYIFFKQ